MAPTETALQLLGPATKPAARGRAAVQRARPRELRRRCQQATFRVAASDYLDPLFLPELVAQLKRLAPQVRLELLPLSGEYDYRRASRPATSTW